MTCEQLAAMIQLQFPIQPPKCAKSQTPAFQNESKTPQIETMKRAQSAAGSEGLGARVTNSGQDQFARLNHTSF